MRKCQNECSILIVRGVWVVLDVRLHVKWSTRDLQDLSGYK